MDLLPFTDCIGSRRRYLSENADVSGSNRLPSYYTSDVHVSDIETNYRQRRTLSLRSRSDKCDEPRTMKRGLWNKELRNRFRNLGTSLKMNWREGGREAGREGGIN
ncbi:hypothetical protein MAR_038043 [Mya arenaria]|uniref:Uncharacterized protein n=1 Tax=Mya arenaria TaxID=6604 RepID=A0ABY7FSW5_MYAAR|nr:hypothetical protein MAR_038043 [Mya arenaria]